MENCKDFDGDILEFLELENISARDKIWVATRVFPKFLVEVFVIDCAFSAYAASEAAARPYASSASEAAARAYASSASDAAAYASSASDAAAYATTYADAAALSATDAAALSAAAASSTSVGAASLASDPARTQEQENQVDALIMLIKGEKEL